MGNLSTTSYPVCQQVLRSRAFGVTDPSAPRPGEDMLDLSLLGPNPPDDGLRRKLPAAAQGWWHRRPVCDPAPVPPR